MAIVSRADNDGIMEYMGLSSDTKPSGAIPPFSTFWETDTRQGYVYDGIAWRLV